jgi:hypothetical protein
MEEYGQLIQEVLSLLQKLNLVAMIIKCKLYKSKIEFLGYLISNTDMNIAQNNN